jgi:hypothetical protein
MLVTQDPFRTFRLVHEMETPFDTRNHPPYSDEDLARDQHERSPLPGGSTTGIAQLNLHFCFDSRAHPAKQPNFVHQPDFFPL